MLHALLFLGAAAAAFAGFLLVGLPRTGSGVLWASARLPPVSVLARLALSSKGRSWDAARGCARYCRPRDASLALVAVMSRLGCPPPGVVGPLVERGLLAPLAHALRSGCSLGEEYGGLEEALRALLGLAPEYGRAPTVYACLGNHRAVLIGDRVYSTALLPERLAWALEGLAPPPPPEGGVVLQYGCRGPGVRLERLAKLVLPEAPSSMPWLAYHLSLEPPDPGDPEELARSALRAARRLAWLSRLAGEERPWEALVVEKVFGSEPVECPGRPVLTDSPVLGCPYYSPYEAAPMSGAVGDARAMLASLRARGGNPVRAAVMRMLEGDEEEARALIEAARPSPREARGPVQVEPWYAQCAGVTTVEERCFRPPMDCGSWQGPGPVEELAESLGLEPAGPPQCGGEKRRPSRARRHGDLEHRYLEPEGDHLGALVEAARTGGEGSVLVVAPDEASARVVRALTGLPSPLECPHCGRAVTSWTLLQAMPWLARPYSEVLLLYPEKFPKPPHLLEKLSSPTSYLREAVEWLLQLTSGPGRLSLSRALRHATGQPPTARVGAPRRPSIPAGPALEGLESLFRRLWGAQYRLREHQRSAIRALLEGYAPPPGRPVLTVLPTGYGKSAIFQLSGLLLSRLTGSYTLVVSPLRALLRDQVESLLRRGLPAARVDAGVSGRARRALLEAASLGLLDFLYVTPERFQDPAFYAVFADSPPALAVLDEAHTVVKWGGSFRPSYYYAVGSIRDLRPEAGGPHVALFTATAPGRVAREILSLLGYEKPVESRLPTVPGGGWEALILRAPTVRENLEFAVLPVPRGEERLRQLARVIGELSEWAGGVSEPWLGVVFTGYVKSERHPWANAEALADWVARETGLEAIAYHGQLGERERRRREDAIYRASRTGEGPRVVVATKAFGMGVDIPNIRWIVHVLPSDSAEDYYQEAGRAGRDGLPAVAVHLYNSEDFEEKRRSILLQRPRPSMVLRLYNTIVTIHSSIREREGGWPLVALPLDALPSPVRALKAADYLRSAGLLDYWVVQQPIAAYRVPREAGPEGPVPGEEILPWSMSLGGGVVVGPDIAAPPGWERVPLRVETCTGRGPIIPVRISAGGREVKAGDCAEWKSTALPRRPRVLLAFLDMDRRHERLSVLPPELFAHVARLGAMELEGLDEYMRIMGSAAGLAARHGWRSREVDQHIKTRLEEALSSEPPPPPGRPSPSLLGAMHTCSTAGECAGLAAEIILEAERWLGTPRAVSLVLQDDSLARLVADSYSRLAGRPLEAEVVPYRRLLRASREGPHTLMDLGYIVVLARILPRTVEALQRLEGYPYHSRLLYHR